LSPDNPEFHEALAELPAMSGKPVYVEIDAFLRCVRTGEKLASHIDTVILSSQIIQAIYDSSEQRGEIALQAEGGRIEG